ncbi:MAG: ABC transporter permease subunit [Saprospiraceae bacterium]|nr:ABC transporter permease subunit [Saprospiraceae bacterium]
MFFLQLQYETLRLMRSPILWLLLVFLAGCIGFGTYNGVQRVAAKHQTVREMLTKQQEDLQQQKLAADSVIGELKTVGGWWLDPTNVIVVGGVWAGGRVTALEPAPQSILAAGMSDLQPDAWRLTLTGKEPRGDSEFENPVNLAFGAFDIAFVLTFLLPLLVIALAFNLMSSEREQGTLALQWAQPVALGQVFLMKTLARFTLLAGLTVLVTLPALAIADLSPLSSAALHTTGLAVLYVLFWFLLVLGVNLRGGSSAQNALICIGAWLLFVLIIPAVVNLVSEKIHPVPSRAGYTNAMREADIYLAEQREKLLDVFYQKHPNYTRKTEENMEWKDWYRESFGIMDFEEKVRDSITNLYEGKAVQQTAFANNLTLLSPALSVHRQLNDLAGTSRTAFRAAEAVLDEAQQNWAAWFLKKFDADQTLTVQDYDELMKFPDRIVAAPVSGAYAGSFWLAAQCLLGLIWAWFAGRKHRFIPS